MSKKPTPDDRVTALVLELADVLAHDGLIDSGAHDGKTPAPLRAYARSGETGLEQGLILVYEGVEYHVCVEATELLHGQVYNPIGDGAGERAKKARRVATRGK